jgi:enamine deaminase RidA (YjgF/YER057c/UK114 family)
MYVEKTALNFLMANLLEAGGASTKAGIVFTSGTVPSVNGTIVSGGIAAQTVSSVLTFFTNEH